MRSYRKILKISFLDHITNEELRKQIREAFDVHNDRLTMLKKNENSDDKLKKFS